MFDRQVLLEVAHAAAGGGVGVSSGNVTLPRQPAPAHGSSNEARGTVVLPLLPPEGPGAGALKLALVSLWEGERFSSRALATSLSPAAAHLSR